jgi:hypothetical protein
MTPTAHKKEAFSMVRLTYGLVTGHQSAPIVLPGSPLDSHRVPDVTIFRKAVDYLSNKWEVKER